MQETFSIDKITGSTPRAKLLRLAIAGLAILNGCSNSKSSNFDGGCQQFEVYAQNRWNPLGAAERERPELLSKKVGGFIPNSIIEVNGWLHSSKEVYPNNDPPFNSDIWFRTIDNRWVSFAGVRAEPTEPDQTGHASGGKPAIEPTECQLIKN